MTDATTSVSLDIEKKGSDKIRTLSALFDRLRWIPANYTEHQEWYAKTDHGLDATGPVDRLPAAYPGKRRYELNAYGATAVFVVKYNTNGGYHVYDSYIVEHGSVGL